MSCDASEYSRFFHSFVACPDVSELPIFAPLHKSILSDFGRLYFGPFDLSSFMAMVSEHHMSPSSSFGLWSGSLDLVLNSSVCERTICFRSSCVSLSILFVQHVSSVLWLFGTVLGGVSSKPVKKRFRTWSHAYRDCSFDVHADPWFTSVSDSIGFPPATVVEHEVVSALKEVDCSVRREVLTQCLPSLSCFLLQCHGSPRADRTCTLWRRRAYASGLPNRSVCRSC